MKQQNEANKEWFTEAKLGMFIHWMAYSAARKSDNLPWGVPLKDYRFLLDRFTLESFDPDAFVLKAKARGFRYIVPTAHHADGLCLWDSATTDFKTTNGPRPMDLIKELSAACRKHGLKFGVYLPYCDMSHPTVQHLAASGKMDSGGWGDNPPLKGRDLQKYLDHLEAQVRELCTHYGKLDLWWWDAGPGVIEWAEKVRALVYELQPGILQNGRIGSPVPNNRLKGDFFSPEGDVPSIPLTENGKSIRWETCLPTIVNSWVYDENKHTYASARTLVRTLVEAISKGGNLLLNLGPEGDGRVPAEIDDALDRMGDWLRMNGGAIWGTHAGPRHDIPNVALTRNANTLYVHYYGNEQRLVLPGLGAVLEEARFLANGARIGIEKAGEEIVLDLASSPRDPFDTVLRLEFSKAPSKTGMPVPIPATQLAQSVKIATTEPTPADWARVKPVTVTAVNGISILVRQPTAEELSFAFSVLNDEHHLHLRVEVRQANLGAAPVFKKDTGDHFAEKSGARANEELIKNSAISVYIDALPVSQEQTADKRCFQIVVNASGKSFVYFADGNVESKDDTIVPYTCRVEKTSLGYTVYCTVPFSSMIKDTGRTEYEYDLTNFFGAPHKNLPQSTQLEPVQAGDTLGFNLSAMAPMNDGDGELIMDLWWQARSHCPFNDPHQWGRLKLAK